MAENTFEEDTISVSDRLAAEALIVDVDGYEGPLDLLLTLGRTQKVGHKCPTPGAKFQKRERAGCTLIQPHLRQCQADQLPKHLTDLGCRGEVTQTSKRILAHIIAVFRMPECEAHEPVDAHWAR